MNRIIIVIFFAIAISVILLCFNSSDKLSMDKEMCGEVALEYMKNKYGKEFKLIISYKPVRISGSDRYVKVEVQNPEDEKIYLICVYPDGKSDEDKDGFYDSYKVISDEYMCVLVKDYVTSGLSELISDAGLTEFSCTASMKTKENPGEWGITSEFPIPTEETFSIKNVLQNYPISIYCWVKIPESQNSATLQQDIESVFKPLVLKGFINFVINIYSDEDYAKIKETDNVITENKIEEKNHFSFKVKNLINVFKK